MKLINGMIMLALAVMIIDPELIGSVTSSILVILVAVAIALLKWDYKIIGDFLSPFMAE